MTGHELIAALKDSGTGPQKIQAAENLLREQPRIDPREMIRTLALPGPLKPRSVIPDPPAWPEGTISKARSMLDGTYIAPVPPKEKPVVTDLEPFTRALAEFVKETANQPATEHKPAQAAAGGKR